MYPKTEQEIMKTWADDCNVPTVSICCTTYNHENYIAEAIDGFLMQETDFPFEILIRDDCSTDKTASIVKEYADKYPQLIKPVFEKENTYSQGVKPMPQLYKIAKGEYIATCEGDDYWTDALKLQIQVDFLEGNEEYVIIYSAVEAFDENGKMDNYIGGVTWDLESIELQKTKPINTLTVCFRNIIKEFPFEMKCSKFGDIFLWSLVGAYGKGKFMHNIKPSMYRIHNGGIFSKQTTIQKYKMNYTTYFALSCYYQRINNEYLSSFFEAKSVHYSILVYGRVYYFKEILRSLIVPIRIIRTKLALRTRLKKIWLKNDK